MDEQKPRLLGFRLTFDFDENGQVTNCDFGERVEKGDDGTNPVFQTCPPLEPPRKWDPVICPPKGTVPPKPKGPGSPPKPPKPKQGTEE